MDELADDDLVALPFHGYLNSLSPSANEEAATAELQLRLCVVRNQHFVYPLIRHEDDVETDLFLDPRYIEKSITWKDMMQWWIQHHHQSSIDTDEESSNEITAPGKLEYKYYGVGWYGQRPVPSLGGGPGYGAEADEVWSIEEDVLERLLSEDGVDLPVIDVGMAHGEKARGGALF
jgi:hypothetical protein